MGKKPKKEDDARNETGYANRESETPRPRARKKSKQKVMG